MNKITWHKKLGNLPLTLNQESRTGKKKNKVFRIRHSQFSMEEKQSMILLIVEYSHCPQKKPEESEEEKKTRFPQNFMEGDYS